jgi:diaminohydroxyphosphoribosylaminopyrimidine deaminase/5-amino-6-(5-phosphoribosylamino)uracil reductase
MLSRRAQDDKFMGLALAEARKGIGYTSPNPTVGAVIVRDGRVLARGHHHAAGQPHAEIEAILALRKPELARGATLYVTLEPCSTLGRTPPCTAAIIQQGFARVVFGATDHNPAHAGRAEKILRDAGLTVRSGVLSAECTALNVGWNHWIRTRQPYVIAKCGMSLDGRISSHPEARWITSAAARADAMELRARVDAILVGGGTIRADDPQLTVRLPGATRQPWRVVVTKSGRLPRTARVFTDEHRERTLVFQGTPLREVLAALGALDVTSVLIEGGGRILGEAFDQGLVHKANFYVAPQILGGPTPAIGGNGVEKSARAWRLETPDFSRIGDDVRISGVVIR